MSRMPPHAKPFQPPPVSPETRVGDYLPGRRVEPHAAPQIAASAAMQAVEAALARLEETIEAENEALDGHQRIDFADVNRRKSQLLLELTRLSRGLPEAAGATLTPRLTRLHAKLAHNQRALEMHVNAVREIAELMVSVLGEAESDGTYGRPTRRPQAR
jgi:hypothetical protein